MFIIEGPDCVGKTTVANKIVDAVNRLKKFPAYYQHMTRPPDTFDFHFHYRDMMSMFAVMDRFHLGALAYHPKGTLTESAREFVEEMLLNFRSMILIIYASNEQIYNQKLREHNREREEMFDFETLLKANKIFADEALGSKKEYCIWDITPEGSHELVYPNEFIIKYWSKLWVDYVLAKNN